MSSDGQALRARTDPVWSRIRRSVLGGAAGVATSICAFLAISRLVDPREYGRAAVILAVWGILFNAIDWCGALLMRFGPVELGRAGTLRVTIATRLLFALPPLALMAIALPCAAAAGRLPPALAAVTALWMLVGASYNVLYWSAIAAQRFGPLTVAGVLVKGAPALALAGCLATSRPVRAEALLGATLASTAVAAAVLLAALRPLVGIGRPDRGLLGAMWRFGLPSLVGLPSQSAIAWLDPLLLDRWASRADVGRFQLACPTFTLFATLGASLNAVLSPELVRGSTDENRSALARYRDRTQPRAAPALALAAFAGACVAAPVVRALLPARYAITAELVALLAVAGGFLLAFWTLHPLVNATDSVWSLQASVSLQAATNVALDLALTPRLGSIGIAMANVAAWLVAYVALSLLLKWRIGAHTGTLPLLVAAGALVTALLVAGAPIALRVATAFLLLAAAGAAAAWGRAARGGSIRSTEVAA